MRQYTANDFASPHAALEAAAANASSARLVGLKDLYSSPLLGEAVHHLLSLEKTEREVSAARERARAVELAVQKASEDADLFALEQNRAEAEFREWAAEISSSL